MTIEPSPTAEATRLTDPGLLVQIGDGLPDVVDGARAHAAAVVEDPVHRGLADSGLTRYLPDRVGVGHATFLMDF
jgi:hypothetical protein